MFGSTPSQQQPKAALVDSKNAASFYAEFTNCDEKKVRAFLAGTGPHVERFKKLSADLAKITEEKDRLSVSMSLIQFLKKAVTDALIDYDFKPNEIQMELCVAGSLAKNLATPYSDIDCLLILNENTPEAQKKKIKQLGIDLKFLSLALFLINNQFAMDPFGISIAYLCGTTEEILDQIKLRETQDDISALTVSVCNAKSVFGKNELLFVVQTALDKQFEAVYYFKKAIEEYNGPKDLKSVNIKADLLRPLDFILQAFRKQQKLSIQEFSEPKKLLEKLVELRVISDSVRNLIDYIQERAYQLRYQLHTQKKKEHDEIKNPGKDVTDLVGLVGWLRGSLKYFLDNPSKFKTFDLQARKYLSQGDDAKKLENRLQRIELICNGVYSSLRKPPAIAKAADLPDSRFVIQLKGYFEELPPVIHVADLADIAKKLKGNKEVKLSKEAAQVVEAIAKISPSIKQIIVQDILKRIGGEKTEMESFQTVSLKIDSLSRIFNLVPPGFNADELKSISALWGKTQAELTIEKEKKQTDYLQLYFDKMQVFLSEVLNDFIFPELLDAQGRIRASIWNQLYFNQLIGHHETLNRKILDETTLALVSGFVSLAIGGMREIHKQLKDGHRYQFSTALSGLMELQENTRIERQDTTFLERKIIRYLLWPTRRALASRIERNQYDVKFRELILPVQDKIDRLPLKELRMLRSFLDYGKTESDLIAFVVCFELETSLSSKYQELQREMEELTKKGSTEMSGNRFEKNFLLYRAIVDIQDFKMRKISLDQLVICMETYVNDSQAIPHLDKSSKAFNTYTHTTKILTDAQNQLTLLRQLDVSLKPPAPPIAPSTATAAIVTRPRH